MAHWADIRAEGVSWKPKWDYRLNVKVKWALGPICKNNGHVNQYVSPIGPWPEMCPRSNGRRGPHFRAQYAKMLYMGKLTVGPMCGPGGYLMIPMGLDAWEMGPIRMEAQGIDSIGLRPDILAQWAWRMIISKMNEPLGRVMTEMGLSIQAHWAN